MLLGVRHTRWSTDIQNSTERGLHTARLTLACHSHLHEYDETADCNEKRSIGQTIPHFPLVMQFLWRTLANDARLGFIFRASKDPKSAKL